MVTIFNIRPKGFNVGNDAIFIGMQHFLAEAFGQVVNIVSMPATSRYESQAKAGLTAKTIHEINQYGHGVIVGGGNLYENGELEVALDALDALQVPLMLFSLSMGRIYNARGELVRRTDSMPDRIMQALNQKAAVSLARDKATLAHLHNIGIKYAELGGCPTLFLDQMVDRLPPVPEVDRDTALISVRKPSLMNIPLLNQSHVYSYIVDIIELLKKLDYKDVRFLCHDHRDIPFAASFSGMEYVYTGDVYSYLALLRASALNVTFRMHSFLPCLAFNRPAIKISYDERGLSLVDTLGFGDWNIDLVRSANVVAEVGDRLSRLQDLAIIRQQAKDKWDESYRTMRDGFNRFARDVLKYKSLISKESDDAVVSNATD